MNLTSIAGFPGEEHSLNGERRARHWTGLGRKGVGRSVVDGREKGLKFDFKENISVS